MLNKLSEPGKQYFIAVLLFLIATIIWVWGFNTSYLTRLDAHDYAQMGREISEGNGFSTLQTFPRHIRYLHEKGFLEQENWPNLYRFPLASMINAFLYTFIKDIANVAILQSGIAFLLSIPLFFLLAARLTNITVGVVGTIFFFGNPFIFEAGNDGMSEALAIFFILSAFLC